jgi:2-iminobutanoate/2-iminopropanoate deaminase
MARPAYIAFNGVDTHERSSNMTSKSVGTNPASVAPPMKPHYSNSIRTESGPLLFIAGQVALDADGKLVGDGDIRAQATQVLENIRAIVEANGGAMADIAQVTVYVRDIEAFNSISDIRERYFPSDGPASAIVEVSALAWPEFLIEIAAVAALPS